MGFDNIYRGSNLRIAAGITLLVITITSLVSGAGAKTDIDSCTQISSPGEYVLTQNIGNYAVGACINITSSDVIFDGSNYTLEGTARNMGVYVYNPTNPLTNVTVKNLEVTNWDVGILFQNANNGFLTGNTANLNNRYGIVLMNSSFNDINNNTVSKSAGYGGPGEVLGCGIGIQESSNHNSISYNNISENWYGLFLLNSTFNMINNNTASNNRGFEGEVSGPPPSTGILILGSHNSIRNNNASNNFNGISLMSGGPDGDIVSINNTVEGNTVLNNTGIMDSNKPHSSGILIGASHNNSVRNNTASNNLIGVLLFASTNNKIANNILNSNADKGINVNGAERNIVTGNTARSNGREGIYLGYSNLTMISGNIVLSSTGNGILLQHSNHNEIAGNNASNSLNYPEGYQSSGIRLEDSDVNEISNNTAASNTGSGISLESSDDNTVSSNILFNNEDGAILSSSNDNTLADNIASSNIAGLSLHSSSNNNTINSNNFSFNERGVILYLSLFNIISNNWVTYNNRSGIILAETSTYNNISNNTAGNNNKSGIILEEGSDYNTVKNNKVNSNHMDGIVLSNSAHSTVENNIVSNHRFFEGDVNGQAPSTGIRISGSYDSIKNNNASDNIIGIGVFSGEAEGDVISVNNTIEGNLVINNGVNDETRPPGGGIIIRASQNTIRYNNILNNSFGISLFNSSNNLTFNTVSFNERGIRLFTSHYNNITDNTVTYNNFSGIRLNDASTYNNIVNNIASNNNESGIVLDAGSNYNTLNRNTINLNLNFGIEIYSSSDNLIFNNFIKNARNFMSNGVSGNTWNTTRTSGKNIAGGPNLGGNFWAYPNGTGFSQICTDGNKDGICDSSYALGSSNIDYLPLAPNPEMRGDINRNNKLDTGDATLVLRSIVGLPIPSDYIPLSPRADMNCNGKTDTGDATIILRMIVGLPVPKCWE